MPFNTPNGTRGSRQPRGGRVMRTVNSMILRRIRKRGGAVMGMNALIVGTVGRKTGTERLTPVASFPSEGDGWLIVASAGGAPANPGWYYNIGAHPDKVHVELAGQRIAVTPVQLEGDERVAAWQQIVAASPRFSQYEQTTDRELPIIRLTPVQS